MKPVLQAVLLSSVALTGCCTSIPESTSGRIEGQEWGDTSVCGIFSGWGTTEEPQRSEALYTPVSASEYAKTACSVVAIEDYATCANQVEKYYRESLNDPRSAGSSTSGPFAVVLEEELYLGSYKSDPFSASFRVSSDRNSCKGSYNAIYGDKDAVFRVWCDDGQRGKARIVRDRYGREGIGIVTMDSGAKGQVVFGPWVANLARLSAQR